MENRTSHYHQWDTWHLRDRSKFTGYLGRVLGKIHLKKVCAPLSLVEKSLRPLIFSDFFSKKSLRPPVDGPVPGTR